VITRNRNILATGYNGALPGHPHCIDVGVGCDMVEGHCIRTIHAERNAIASAAKEGISVNGGTVYCTHKPCFECLKVLVAAGVKNIVYEQDYFNSPIPSHYLNRGDIYFKSLDEIDGVQHIGTVPSTEEKVQ